MSLAEIVSVNIQAGTVNPARKGFGVPILIAYHNVWSDSSVRTYTTFSEVKADFAATSLPYLWAQAIFAQKPRPTKIKIGRLPIPTGVFHTVEIDANDMASGSAIVGSMVAPDGSVTAINQAWTTDLATTLAALKTTLDALASVGTCSISPGVLTCPATNAGDMNHFTFVTPGVDVRDATADWGYSAALDAAAIADGDFYGVCVDCNSPKNMDKVARWTLANDREAFFAPQYTKPSQFASGEFSSGSDYTALLANDAAIGLITATPRTAFEEARWVGLMFPRDPGADTWAFKTLAGVGADAWTSTQRGTIETAHANHYTTEAAIAITRPGKTFGGQWIDVVIGLAWLEARLQERIFALLVNVGKIPYTNAGVALIVAEVRAQLKDAENAGVLASGWDVTAQDVADADPADKAARILRGIEFTATLAGAIHEIEINGTVTA